jgi:arsenate reductase (glutaredoxin)
MSTAKVYGIPNCGSVKKALDSLQGQGAHIEFHDFKKLGVPPALLDLWIQQLGLDKLINKKGTTWRKLTPQQQAQAHTEGTAKTLLQENPSLIKRPIVDYKQQLSIGQTDFS